MQPCPRCGSHRTDQRPVVDDTVEVAPGEDLPVIGSTVWCNQCQDNVEVNLHE